MCEAHKSIGLFRGACQCVSACIWCVCVLLGKRCLLCGFLDCYGG